jgi:hypothetical protein
LPSPPGRLEALAEETFLSEVGDVEITEMVYQPGADNSEEIAVVRRSLESVRAEYDRGEYRNHGDRPDLLSGLAGRLGCPAQAASGDQCRVQRWWSPRQRVVW